MLEVLDARGALVKILMGRMCTCGRLINTVDRAERGVCVLVVNVVVTSVV